MKTFAMLAHWTAILFLCGGPLWGMTQSDDPFVQFIAAFIIGSVAMAVAQVHAGRWDEFFGPGRIGGTGMTFITCNRKELVWIALNTAAALMNLWFATWSNIAWLHILFVAVHAIVTGYWVWAIFDNAEQDRLEQEADRLFNGLVDKRVADERWTPELAAQMREIRRVLNGEESQ